MKASYFENILVFIYIISMVVLVSVYHSWHFRDFNQETEKENSAIALSAHLKENSGYKIIHVLGEECSCSEFVSEYLFSRKPSGLAKEFVYFIGSRKSLKEKLNKVGFVVNHMSLADTEKRKVKTVGFPFFQIYNEANELLYSGGYDNRMITRYSKYQDLDILANYKYENNKRNLPIFGCAMSTQI